MLLGFRTELKPNNKQTTLLMQHAGVARHAWNMGLAHTKLILDVNKLYKELGKDDRIKFPSSIDLHKWLVAKIKKAYPWYYESSKSAPQNALRALSEAWKRAFKKTAKPPKFKKKGKHDSFTLDGTIRCEQNRIKLPRIGWVRTFEDLPIGYKPKNATVSRDGEKWFISFRSEVEPEQVKKTNSSVGIDFGIKTFAVLSTGEEIKAPIPKIKRLQAKISKLQYLNRNKAKGSNRWRKAMSKIQVLHYRIKCLRLDFIHKFTTGIAKNYSVICIEDLAVKNMVKNPKLSKAISMQAWSEARRQLTYKADLYNAELQVIGRFEPTSKVHHVCGWKDVNQTLSDRVFYCP